MKKNAWSWLGLSLLCLLSLLGSANAITACGDILTSDTILSTDLNCTGTTAVPRWALAINTSITLDCDYHTITYGWNATTPIGLNVSMNDTVVNVTIKNCNLRQEFPSFVEGANAGWAIIGNFSDSIIKDTIIYSVVNQTGGIASRSKIANGAWGNNTYQNLSVTLLGNNSVAFMPFTTGYKTPRNDSYLDIFANLTGKGGGIIKPSSTALYGWVTIKNLTGYATSGYSWGTSVGLFFSSATATSDQHFYNVTLVTDMGAIQQTGKNLIMENMNLTTIRNDNVVYSSGELGNITLTNITITSYASGSHALNVLSTWGNVTITNLNVNFISPTAWAAVLIVAKNMKISNISITSTGASASAAGIAFTTGTNISVENGFINMSNTTTGANAPYHIWFNNRGNGLNVTNVTLLGETTQQVRIVGGGSSSIINAVFLNVTNLDPALIPSLANGNLRISWYARAQVLDLFSSPIQNAEVNYTNNQTQAAYWGLTDAQGLTPWREVNALFIRNSTIGNLNYSPYNFTANFTTYQNYTTYTFGDASFTIPIYLIIPATTTNLATILSNQIIQGQASNYAPAPDNNLRLILLAMTGLTYYLLLYSKKKTDS